MYLIIHYNEIGLKGKNRGFFEKKLINNLKNFFNKSFLSINKRYGKILIELNDLNEKEKLIESLEFIPGIANFCFAEKTDLNLSKIKKKCFDLLKEKKFNSFKVISKRSNKDFELNSMELNKEIGSFIVEKFNKKVDLHSPELNVFIDVTEKEALIYFNKFNGLSGLPVESSGKMVCSLSGGIDSPVAGFLMMKRGCKIVFVHILNESIQGKAVKNKIDGIVKELTKIQQKSVLYIINFGEIQKELIKLIPSKYRMIIYRRVMMKLINEIALKEKAKAIITGDSLGQVASQTIENINCIHNASELLVLSPLIGLNKEEIIKIAKKINTFNHSIKPYPDCCSFMIAVHPETKAELNKVIEFEKNLNLNKLINSCIKKSEKKIFNLNQN